MLMSEQLLSVSLESGAGLLMLEKTGFVLTYWR